MESATKTHFTLSDEGAGYGDRLQLFNAIAEQIWREQQLVSNRMQWNFTFQAFLAGIFVFAVSNLDGPLQFFVPIVLSGAGLVVSLFCLYGVIAAQDQSTRLKQHWANEFHPSPPANVGDSDIQRGAFPQPFSRTVGSNRGRLASRGVCRAMIVMWAAMIVVTVVAEVFPLTDTVTETFVCEQRSDVTEPGELTMNCESI